MNRRMSLTEARGMAIAALLDAEKRRREEREREREIWQAMEAEADRDLADGDSRTFDSVDEFLDDLDQEDL